MPLSYEVPRPAAPCGGHGGRYAANRGHAAVEELQDGSSVKWLGRGLRDISRQTGGGLRGQGDTAGVDRQDGSIRQWGGGGVAALGRHRKKITPLYLWRGRLEIPMHFIHFAKLGISRMILGIGHSKIRHWHEPATGRGEWGTAHTAQAMGHGARGRGH